ncbi:MAG: hypothetical protein Q9228_001328 [Teloschistes exilis]
MVRTRGRTRASQGAEGEEAAAAATRQRSRSASPPRNPPTYRQRTSAPPSGPQETQSRDDSGQVSPCPPPRRVSQPDRLHPNPTTPSSGVRRRDELARLERDRQVERGGRGGPDGRGGIPATPRPILRRTTSIPRAVPLEDPFVDTPGRPRPAVEGFNLRPPPPVRPFRPLRPGPPGRAFRRRSTESPTHRHVLRRESRRAARQLRDDVREDTPYSDEHDLGSDRTTGSTETTTDSTETDHVGILETDPRRVLPTIEEGRDPILALQAQRASYRLDKRRLRHELGHRDDEIARLQRQVSKERRRAQHPPGAYALPNQHYQPEDRRAPLEEERPRIHYEMRNESPERLQGDNNTADLRPLQQVPQDRSRLVDDQAQEIRRLDEARQRAVDELSAERALREAQAHQIRELNARIQILEDGVAEQDDQIEQNTAQGDGRIASAANDIPPQTANSQQALNGPPAAVPPQQVSAPPQQPQRQRPARRGGRRAPAAAPPQQPQGQRPARRGRQQAPTAAPPVRRLPARACKNNVKSYKEPRRR